MSSISAQWSSMTTGDWATKPAAGTCRTATFLLVRSAMVVVPASLLPRVTTYLRCWVTRCWPSTGCRRTLAQTGRAVPESVGRRGAEGRGECGGVGEEVGTGVLVGAGLVCFEEDEQP